MPSPIEIALSSLLPTVSYLPPELISLSTSLLAQSRSKASSLKPEEEIGRTYASCHIACQRLGHKLALEIGKPAPPVQPKVYNKLHTYLNAVLKTTSTARTANGNKIDQQPQKEGAARSTKAATTSQTTPSKPNPVSTTTPTSRKRKEPATPHDTEASNIPDHLKPTIRIICNSSFHPDGIPHVFAGLSSILSHLRTPSTPKRGTKRQRVSDTGEAVPTSILDSQLTNLAIAVFVVVYSQMKGKWNVHEKEVVERAAQALQRAETGKEPVWDWKGKEENAMLDEVELFKQSIREAWWEMEWIKNVPVPPETREDVINMTLEEMEQLRVERGIPGAKAAAKKAVRGAKTPLKPEKRVSVRGDEMGAAGLLPGLGTMFQPAVDWLSDERLVEFERWKRDVLKRDAFRDAGVVS